MQVVCKLADAKLDGQTYTQASYNTNNIAFNQALIVACGVPEDGVNYVEQRACGSLSRTSLFYLPPSDEPACVRAANDYNELTKERLSYFHGALMVYATTEVVNNKLQFRDYGLQIHFGDSLLLPHLAVLYKDDKKPTLQEVHSLLQTRKFDYVINKKHNCYVLNSKDEKIRTKDWWAAIYNIEKNNKLLWTMDILIPFIESKDTTFVARMSRKINDTAIYLQCLKSFDLLVDAFHSNTIHSCGFSLDYFDKQCYIDAFYLQYQLYGIQKNMAHFGSASSSSSTSSFVAGNDRQSRSIKNNNCPNDVRIDSMILFSECKGLSQLNSGLKQAMVSRAGGVSSKTKQRTEFLSDSKIIKLGKKKKYTVIPFESLQDNKVRTQVCDHLVKLNTFDLPAIDPFIGLNKSLATYIWNSESNSVYFVNFYEKYVDTATNKGLAVHLLDDLKDDLINPPSQITSNTSFSSSGFTDTSNFSSQSDNSSINSSRIVGLKNDDNDVNDAACLHESGNSNTNSSRNVTSNNDDNDDNDAACLHESNVRLTYNGNLSFSLDGPPPKRRRTTKKTLRTNKRKSYSYEKKQN